MKYANHTNSLLKKPIYIEPESVLDNCERVAVRYGMNRKVEPLKSFLFADEIAEETLTLEQFQEREKNIKLIKDILNGVTKGHLVKQEVNILFCGTNEGILNFLTASPQT